MNIRSSLRLVPKLARFSTLAGCSKTDLMALARAGDLVVLPDAWAFIREGEAADACYILLDGAACVFHARRPVATIGTGAIIGEMAYAEGTQRQATVATRGPAQALRIDFARLNQLLASRPQLKAVLTAAYREHVVADAGPQPDN